jgi:hypothetical protein
MRPFQGSGPADGGKIKTAGDRSDRPGDHREELSGRVGFRLSYYVNFRRDSILTRSQVAATAVEMRSASAATCGHSVSTLSSLWNGSYGVASRAARKLVVIVINSDL